MDTQFFVLGPAQRAAMSFRGQLGPGKPFSVIKLFCGRIVESYPASACPGTSIGSASPHALDLGQELDLWRAFDSRPRHFGPEFIGCNKGARRLQIFPFEEKGYFIDVSRAAENPATALAVLVPPIEVGIESRFPSHIIRDFVVNKNIDHDFLGTPFT